jgi:hypothetical protein
MLSSLMMRLADTLDLRLLGSVFHILAYWLLNLSLHNLWVFFFLMLTKIINKISILGRL